MARALVLARRGMGRVRPNPPVGAVVVRDGIVVGEGYHQAAGKPHGEVRALREAGEKARRATLFVTLAPCNHEGRTPPCVEAIVGAGITRVHVATRDPNPESGSGDEALEKAGIRVVMGPGQRAAAFLTAGFASRIERKRPRFSLKMAVSLDGRIASAGGDSRWISSETARAWVHRRRREADGIVIGAETAARDNPALSTRAVSGRSADRFILDSQLRVSPGARVWTKNGVRRVAVSTQAASAENRETLERGGVEVWTLPDDAEGRVDLTAFARRLGDEGYTNMLVEGGGTLAGALFRASLIDVVWLVTSRRLLLGGGGPGWTQGLSVTAVPRAVKIARADLRSLGPDWLTTVVPESAQWWDPETIHV